jgi:hypothetical protein
MAGRGKVDGMEIIDSDGESITHGVKRLRLPLNTLRHVRAEQARVYRQVKANELPSEEGSRRVYMLGQIAKTMTDELQIEEVAKLVEQAKEKLRLTNGNAQSES